MKANWKKVGVDPGPELGMWVLAVVKNGDKRYVKEAWGYAWTTNGETKKGFRFEEQFDGDEITHWDYMPGLPDEEE